MILCAGTGLFNFTSSLGLPTDSIIPYLDKSEVFSSFYDTTLFFASSILSPSTDTPPPAFLAAKLDTCDKKVGDDEEERIIWGEGTWLFNLTSSSVLPTYFIFSSPDKAGLFHSFSDTITFSFSSFLSPSSDTHTPVSYESYPLSDTFPWTPTLVTLPLTHLPRPTLLPPLPLKDLSWSLPNCLYFDALDILAFAFVLYGIDPAYNFLPFSFSFLSWIFLKQLF